MEIMINKKDNKQKKSNTGNVYNQFMKIDNVKCTYLFIDEPDVEYDNKYSVTFLLNKKDDSDTIELLDNMNNKVYEYYKSSLPKKELMNLVKKYPYQLIFDDMDNETENVKIKAKSQFKPKIFKCGAEVNELPKFGDVINLNLKCLDYYMKSSSSCSLSFRLSNIELI